MSPNFEMAKVRNLNECCQLKVVSTTDLDISKECWPEMYSTMKKPALVEVYCQDSLRNLNSIYFTVCLKFCCISIWHVRIYFQKII